MVLKRKTTPEWPRSKQWSYDEYAPGRPKHFEREYPEIAAHLRYLTRTRDARTAGVFTKVVMLILIPVVLVVALPYWLVLKLLGRTPKNNEFSAPISELRYERDWSRHVSPQRGGATSFSIGEMCPSSMGVTVYSVPDSQVANLHKMKDWD